MSEAPVVDAGTMGALRRRSVVLALILAPAVALTVYLVVMQSRGRADTQAAKRAIPAVIDEAGHYWTSVDLRMSELEMRILETRDYVWRTYDDSQGEPVDLCIVFSEDNRKGTHPPDVCLEGNGSRIQGRYERVVEAAPGTEVSVREIVAVQGGVYTYFAYFYKCGDSFTPSFYVQQGKIIWYGLLGRNAGGALIRYSTVVRDPADVAGARARTDELIRATFPAIRDKLGRK